MNVEVDKVGPVQGTASGSPPSVETVWQAHPIAARALRIGVVLAPVVASVGVIFLLNRALPSPRSWESVTAVITADVAVAVTVLLVVHRMALRALPLATLLSLSLVFPDQAPKRFAIVLRANSTSQLRSRIVRSCDHDIDVASALEDLLTYLAALSRHDRTTRGHSERVRAFVDLLAVRMDLSKADQERLRWAALFHDIGKLRVPGPILRKPGKPTNEEWDTLRQHPIDGAEIIRPLASWLGQWADAVAQHHERFDGQGYPSGLVGTDISLGGRILAVADAYEVMITSRPYKRPVRPEAARAELVRHAGQQFDPDIVRAFLSIAIGDLRKVMGLLGVLSEVPILATVPRAEALIGMAGRQAIGAVGTAAGAGAFVAAATLSPVHLPSSSSPTVGSGAHTTAPVPRDVGGDPAVASVALIQPGTSERTNDGPPSSGPLDPNSSRPSTGTDGASALSSISGLAPAEEASSSTNTSPVTDVPSVGAIVGNSPDPATADVTAAVATAANGTPSTSGTTAKAVTSTAGSEVDGLAKASGDGVQLPTVP
jgi:putative nucleotidyltransferase with HDIG domain